MNGIQASMRYAGGAVHRRRGFSFTEIMFAVVILSIGFIMVAAVFPVALQQAKFTTDETTSAAVSRGVAQYVSQVLADTNDINNSNVRADAANKTTSSVVTQIGTVPTAVGPSLWHVLSDNLILPEDRRFAAVVLYRRNGDYTTPAAWSPYVQLYIFPVQVRNKQLFDATDTQLLTGTPPGAPPAANLLAKPIQIAIANDVLEEGFIDLIAIDRRPVAPIGGNVAGPGTSNVDAADEGAYIVIADDVLQGPVRGRMNGQMFRLGARRDDLIGRGDLFGNPGLSNNMDVYELQTGNDFTPDPGLDGIRSKPPVVTSNDDIIAIGNLTPIVTPLAQSDVRADPAAPFGTAQAFVIGRGFTPGTTAYPPTYEGTAMPISAFTTFVRVR